MAKQRKSSPETPASALESFKELDKEVRQEAAEMSAAAAAPVASDDPKEDQPLPQEEPIRATKAEPVRLRGRMTLEDAFQSIGLNCVQQIEANVPGVLKQHVESLHQMRVGLRRLRALLAMFEDLAPPPVALHASIEWLSGELGPARDWDVLADSTLERVQGFDSAALRQAAHERANAHHAHILNVLREPRYLELMAQLNEWLGERRWRPDATLAKDSPLAERAAKAALPLLRKAEKRLAKRIDGLEEGDAPGRHRVRIAAKKARYAAEFFRDLLPARRVKRYVGHLEKLQDRLGLLNDLAVADHLLEELKGGSSQVSKQAAYVRGYVAASSEARVQGLSKALADVARCRITR
ncbi:CHAD domain-containing protein [Telluria beijingensis]|uniref:CHAD domain-containing protein n=1 Tax=Telluria beijingensis TaxID=3068633 RepID=UPI0027958597|nr:CHAD domain-containing protein [Massilia sp. REN29]